MSGPQATSSGMPDEKRHWLDDPRSASKIFYALVVVCVLLVLSDLLYHKHVHFGWEHWLGFHAFYGLLGSLFLVLTAKALRRVLMRDEDYYDRDDR